MPTTGVRRSLSSRPAKLRVEVLDLSDSGDSVDQIELMFKRLKTLGLYRSNLLYRGVDGGRMATIRQHGTDQNQEVVYCSKEQDMLDPFADPAGNAYYYAEDCPIPAFIVYNPDLLLEEDGEYGYTFAPGVKPLSAVVAVFLLN